MTAWRSHNDGWRHGSQFRGSGSNLHDARTCLSSTVHRGLFEEPERWILVCRSYSGCKGCSSTGHDWACWLYNELYIGRTVPTFQLQTKHTKTMSSVLHWTEQLHRTGRMWTLPFSINRCVQKLLSCYYPVSSKTLHFTLLMLIMMCITGNNKTAVLNYIKIGAQ